MGEPPKSKEDEGQKESKPDLSGGRVAEIKYSLYLMRRNLLVLLGTGISLGSIFVAVFSGYLVSSVAWKFTDPDIRLCWNNPLINWHITSIFVCPGQNLYVLGTDYYGRDLLKMIILALPTDLELAFAVVVSAFFIGIGLGAAAAYAGGKLDEAILRVTDVFFAIPPLVLAIVVLSVFGRSLENLAIAVLITWWPLYVRLVRSQVLAEKEKTYVEALRCMGASRFRILFLHIIPNSIYPVLVQFTLDIGGVILTISSLMFLGFSPNPLLPELGNLANSGIDYVSTAPWLIIFPGLTILIVSLGFNLLGDGIRDILDPRLRR